MNQNSSVGPKPAINVGVPERIASVLAGSMLIINGLRNGKLGLLRLAAGGWLLFRGGTGHCPLYNALGKERLPDPVKNINIRTTVKLNKPRNEVYAFWRRLENLPLFMRHLESVHELDGRRSHWKARIPGGLGTLGWDAEIVKEEEGRFLGWNSMEGAAVENAGKVEFQDAVNGGTILHVVITYRAPLGVAGQGLSMLLNPMFERMVREDILNFKIFMETGTLPEAASQYTEISVQ